MGIVRRVWPRHYGRGRPLNSVVSRHCAKMSTRAKAIGTTIEDNLRVRITEWRFAPGAETGWHQHTLDYVAVYGTSGQLLAETKEGLVPVQVRAGQSYFRKAGVEHNIVNSGNEDLVFVETELK